MAKRIATEYVHARFQLSSIEMQAFIKFMDQQQLCHQVLIHDNGSQSLVLEDCVGHEKIKMTFERQSDHYVCEMSCRIVHVKLTDAMRKAVSLFHGNAIVNRIYSNYTMQYIYKDGKVHRIVEVCGQQKRIVFEKKDTLQKLQNVFNRELIEKEIMQIYARIDGLLDRRNIVSSQEELINIDAELKQLTFNLFKLEA